MVGVRLEVVGQLVKALRGIGAAIQKLAEPDADPNSILAQFPGHVEHNHVSFGDCSLMEIFVAETGTVVDPFGIIPMLHPLTQPEAAKTPDDYEAEHVLDVHFHGLVGQNVGFVFERIATIIDELHRSSTSCTLELQIESRVGPTRAYAELIQGFEQLENHGICIEVTGVDSQGNRTVLRRKKWSNASPADVVLIHLIPLGDSSTIQ